MKRLTLYVFATVALAACSEPIPGEDQAQAICAEYCVECGDGNPECYDICMDQWATYGAIKSEPHQECGARYVLARECQTLNGCAASECGDPYNDMVRCVLLIE